MKFTVNGRWHNGFKSALGAFLAAASVAGVIGHADVSQAFWARQDASYCTPSLGDPAAYANGCNTSAGGIVVSCPVEDSSSNPKTSITALNLHVDDKAATSVIAQRCVNFFGAVGTSCGPADSSANGLDMLTPPSFVGWSAADFGFLVVTIPSRQNNQNSCIKGYFTSG